LPAMLAHPKKETRTLLVPVDRRQGREVLLSQLRLQGGPVL
jgi:hypothetical protein